MTVLISKTQLDTELRAALMDFHKGYKVVETEADGCDEYGTIYWVTCANGWGGRSWDIQTDSCRDFFRMKKIWIEEGFLASDAQRYQIPRDFYFKEIPITDIQLFTPTDITPITQMVEQVEKHLNSDEFWKAPFHFPSNLNLTLGPFNQRNWQHFLAYTVPMALYTNLEDFRESLNHIEGSIYTQKFWEIIRNLPQV